MATSAAERKAQARLVTLASGMPGKRTDEAWTAYVSRVRPIAVKLGATAPEVFKLAGLAKENRAKGARAKATEVKPSKPIAKPVPKGRATQTPSSHPAPRPNGTGARPVARGTSTPSGAPSRGRISTPTPTPSGRAMRAGEVRGGQMCEVCGLHPANPRESAINRSFRCIYAQAQAKGRGLDLAQIAKAAGVKKFAQ